MKWCKNSELTNSSQVCLTLPCQSVQPLAWLVETISWLTWEDSGSWPDALILCSTDVVRAGYKGQEGEAEGGHPPHHLRSLLTRSAVCQMLPPGKNAAFFPGDVHAHKVWLFGGCFSETWTLNMGQELNPRTWEVPSASESLGFQGQSVTLLKNVHWLPKASQIKSYPTVAS